MLDSWTRDIVLDRVATMLADVSDQRLVPRIDVDPNRRAKLHHVSTSESTRDL